MTVCVGTRRRASEVTASDPRRPMLYRSTRGGEHSVPFEKALLSAYASDGGLYVPESLPMVTETELRSWASLTMAQVCARVMVKFTDLSLAELEPLAFDAFKSFNDGVEPPLPISKVGDSYHLDTGLGPTLAFKDFALQLLGRQAVRNDSGDPRKRCPHALGVAAGVKIVEIDLRSARLRP